MVRFKIMRLSNLIYFLVVSALLIAVVFLSWRLLSGNPVSYGRSEGRPETEKIQGQGQNDDIHPAYQSMLSVGFPAVAATDKNADGMFSVLWNMMFRGDIRDPRVIMNYPMPYLGQVSKLPDHDMDGAMEVASNHSGRGGIDRPSNPIDISEVDSDEDILQVSDDIKIQINQLKVDDNPIKMTGEGPKILIYHSHSREAYKQDPKDPYKEASYEPFRTDDDNYSVIKVGTTLSHALTSKGIAVLHDQSNHERKSYNASYSQSLETLKKHMAEHDSLNLFIDIHRNDYGKKSSKKPDDEVVVINGERVAKVFVVIGTGEGVVGAFSNKPNWKENDDEKREGPHFPRWNFGRGGVGDGSGVY